MAFRKLLLSSRLDARVSAHWRRPRHSGGRASV